MANANANPLAGMSTKQIAQVYIAGNAKVRAEAITYAKSRLGVSTRKTWKHLVADLEAGDMEKIQARADGYKGDGTRAPKPAETPAKSAAKPKAAPKTKAKTAPKAAPKTHEPDNRKAALIDAGEQMQAAVANFAQLAISLLD